MYYTLQQNAVLTNNVKCSIIAVKERKEEDFMKKLVGLVTMVLICFFMTYSVNAYRIGDVVGKTLYTDIVAQINGYDIPSYNVDGYTYIVAEDLKNYGFYVNWSPSTRTLAVSRNYSVSKIGATYVKPIIDFIMFGEVSDNILYTDIKTYVNNYYTQSYNIGGRTIIRFDSLEQFGSVVWNAAERKISLTLSGIPQKNNTSVVGQYLHTVYPENYWLKINSCDGEYVDFSVMALKGSNASRVAGIRIKEKINNGVCNFYFKDDFMNVGTGTLRISGKTATLSFSIYEYGNGWCVDAAAGSYVKK